NGWHFLPRSKEGPEQQNRPEIIDSALLRPGRLDQHIYISPQNFEFYIKRQVTKMPTTVMNNQIPCLVQDTDGFSEMPRKSKNQSVQYQLQDKNKLKHMNELEEKQLIIRY
ncbi:32556_t:CDS:2, partial [Racocetra persica]